jgi:hypothetical protein
VILPISASHIVGITGMSHQAMAVHEFFDLTIDQVWGVLLICAKGKKRGDFSTLRI